jgi:Fe-S cluster assembly iron-binding protein IscA
VFTITEAAKKEIVNRLTKSEATFVRLQMRFSCLMKMKLTLEESTQTDDEEINIEDINFIIDKDQRHYFANKQIDYIPDHNGFREFEAGEQL